MHIMSLATLLFYLLRSFLSRLFYYYDLNVLKVSYCVLFIFVFLRHIKSPFPQVPKIILLESGSFEEVSCNEATVRLIGTDLTVISV